MSEQPQGSHLSSSTCQCFLHASSLSLVESNHCLRPPCSTCLQTHLCRGPTSPSTPKCLETTSQSRYLPQLNPQCKTVLVAVVVVCNNLPAFRTTPRNSRLPSRLPRNTQATPTSITSEELAVVGDHLSCLCTRASVWGDVAAAEECCF